MALLSRIALRIKSFINQKVILTSLSDARNAAEQGSKNVTTAMVVITARARCSPQPAAIVAKKLKYPSNLEVINQFIAAIAIEKSVQVDNKI